LFSIGRTAVFDVGLSDSKSRILGSGTVWIFRFIQTIHGMSSRGRKRVPRFHQRASIPEKPLPGKTKGPSILL